MKQMMVKLSNQISIPVEFVKLTNDLNQAVVLSSIFFNEEDLVNESAYDFSKNLNITPNLAKLSLNKLEELGLIRIIRSIEYGIDVEYYQINEKELFFRIENQVGKKYPERDFKKIAELKKKEEKYTPQYFFDLWNKQGIKVHREITDRIKEGVNKVLELITPEEFEEAIINYGNHLKAPNSHWTYKWAFDQFMQRGFSKQGKEKGGGFWYFIDNPIDIDEWEFIRQEFEPLTSIYSQIFDENTQKYYGFDKQLINSQIRQEDVFVMIENKYKIYFDGFMELEWIIAGFLFNRKREPGNKYLCKKYLRVWKKVKDEFKKEARQYLKEKL